MQAHKRRDWGRRDEIARGSGLAELGKSCVMNHTFGSSSGGSSRRLRSRVLVVKSSASTFGLVFSVPTEHKRPNFRSSPDISTQQNYH